MFHLKHKLLELRNSILKPKPALTLVEWADKYRYLSPEASSTPGKWSTDLVEAARGPMLAITEKGVKKITVMGPTQLLKTEFINNVVGYFISQDPAPLIVMQPIDKLADTWSTDRLEPMIRDTPILNGLIKDKRVRDSGNTKHHKSFPGGHISIVSARSPSDVASRPVRVVLMDEVDKYKSSGNEGDPEKLIEQRTETFWNALSIAVCSPTNEGSSKIASRFAESDQRYFHGLCPYCNEHERLVWEQVKYQDNEPSTAAYHCSKCSAVWSEVDRLNAVSKGCYIATKPFTGHAGFHCNAIASPWKPLSNMVEKFLEAKKDIEKLKVFVNTSLAETWKPIVDTPDYERLFERKESYPIGVVPAGKQIQFLTLGGDVQADRIEVQVVGWCKDKQSYSVDYLIIPGLTHTDEPWNELQKVIDRHWPVENSKRLMPLSFSCIDSNYNTPKVYEFISKFSPNKVRAIKGSDSLLNTYKMGNDLVIKFDGSKSKLGHKLWMVGSSFLKDDLYAKLKLSSGEVSGVYPPGFCHFPAYEMEFFKQLTAEALQLVRKGGKTTYEWVKLRPRNEALDTWVYARAAASMFGLDRFTEREWQYLEGIAEDEEKTPEEKKRIEAAKSASAKKSPAHNGIWRNPNLRRPR